MNVKKDDYQGLLNQISTAADKSFSENQIVALIENMQTLGWGRAYRLTVTLLRSSILPRNIYGHVLMLLEDEINRIRKAFYDKEQWKPADENCATPEEFSLTMRCIGLISRFNGSTELLERFGEYMKSAEERGTLLETLKRTEEIYTDLLTKESKNETITQSA